MPLKLNRTLYTVNADLNTKASVESVQTLETELSNGVPSGVVHAYSGTTLPTGWLLCDGSAISRITYSNLFSIISTSHGSGDGSTTFNLPDYRGQFLRGRVNITTISGSGTVPVSPNNTTATFLNHGINRTGFKVRLSSGTLGGLAGSTDYFAIVIDSNTLAFATTLANSLAGTRITLTSASVNSAVIVQYEDPDYASRTASTIGGNSQNNIGSMQDNNFQSHSHAATVTPSTTSVVSINGSGGSLGNTSSTLNYGNVTLSTTASIANSGGGETRPKNILVNYIIKY
jgi:microcystin-dependent protein